MEAPKKLTVEKVMDWLKMGLRLFVLTPWNWILISFMLLALVAVFSLLPMGDLILAFLLPFLMGGLYLAMHQFAQKGKPPEVGDLLLGFQEKKWKPLLALGLINIGVGVAMAMIMAFSLMVILGLMGELSTLEHLPLDGLGQAQMQSLLQGDLGFALMLSFLIALMAAVPWAMIAWFAVPLIALGEREAMAALKESFMACWQNLWPITLFMLLQGAVLLLGAMFFGIGLLVAVPVVLLANFCAFSDIFSPAEEAKPPG